jgi:hypothetical protein
MNDSVRLDWVMKSNWLIVESARNSGRYGITKAYYKDGEIQFKTVVPSIYSSQRAAVDAAIATYTRSMT